MNEELVIVPHPTVGSNCILIYGDDPRRTEWACARFNTCSSGPFKGCTAGARNVWIKQSDMTRYLALRLVS